jgi:hypothetical protein
MDHESQTQKVEGNGTHEEPFEVIGLADEESDNEDPESGDNVEDTADITSLGESEIVNNLQI